MPRTITRGDFRFTPLDIEDKNIYSVNYVPDGRHLGSIEKEDSSWIAHPNPAPYGSGDMTMVEAAQALLKKLISEAKVDIEDFQEWQVD